MVTTTTCPQCGAPVLTVRTAKNRSLTLDKEPTTDGTIELRGQRAVNVGLRKLAAQKLYTIHGATCSRGRKP